MNDDKFLNIAKSIQYNKNDKYIIFPKTTLDNIKYSDCNDTIEGICYTDKTLDECINLCDKSGNCGIGHYIETPKNNYCIPIKKDLYPLSYFTRKLREQSIYPELNGTISNIFVNTKEYKFPPDHSNTVFCYDDFKIKCNNLIMGIGDSDPPDTNFHKKGNQNVQAIVYGLTESHLLKYMPIKYQSQDSDKNKYHLRLSNTSNILIKNQTTNELEWKYKILTTDSSYITFTFKNYNNDSDVLYYNTKFYMFYNEINLCYVSDNVFKTTTKSIEQMIDEVGELNLLFEFVPNIDAYYCDNGNCKYIDLNLAKCDKEKCRYNNNIVYRNSECFNLCKNKIKIWIYILILFIITIIILILIRYIFHYV
jgi:hypothetical protein